MNGSGRLISGRIGLLVLLVSQASCAASSESVSLANRLTITPVARWIFTADDAGRANKLESFGAFLDSIERHDVEYNETYRRPGTYTGAVVIDCSRVRSFGVVFSVDISRLPSAYTKKELVLHFQWETSLIETNGKNYDYFIKPRPGWGTSGDKRLFTSGLDLKHGLELTNGMYTVRVSYRGDEVYRDSFELTGCKNAS